MSTTHNVTTDPHFVAASPSARVKVTAIGDNVYYHSTTAVSSSTKEGTLTPAGLSGTGSVVLSSPRWFASNHASLLAVEPVTAATDFTTATSGPYSVAPSWWHPVGLSDDGPVTNEAGYARFETDQAILVSNIGVRIITADAVHTPLAISVGIYDADLSRLVTSGVVSIDVSATGIVNTPITPLTLEADTIYYIGISFGTVAAPGVLFASVLSTYGDLFGSAAPELLFDSQGTAHPLPATATPSGTFAFCPLLLLS